MSSDLKQLNQIDLYLAGKLQDEALDDFEAALMSDVGLQDQLQLEISFRAGLKEQQQELLKAPPLSIWRRFTQLIISPSWAYASTALLIAVVTLNVFRPSLDGVDGLVASEVGSLVYLEQTRSNLNSVNAVAGLPLVLVIDAMGLEAGDIELIIYSGDVEITRVSALTITTDQTVNVSIPGLKIGEYRMELTNGKQSYQYVMHAMTAK